MVTEQRGTQTVYEVYCRECDWQAPDTVELKGLANVLAGRHISETGHVVALKTVEREADEDVPADDFYRGRDRSVSFELLRPVDGEPAGDVRRCGPVDCVVESG